MNPIEELQQIVKNQKSVSTSRLAKIVKKVDRQRIEHEKKIRKYRKKINDLSNPPKVR